MILLPALAVLTFLGIVALVWLSLKTPSWARIAIWAAVAVGAAWVVASLARAAEGFDGYDPVKLLLLLCALAATACAFLCLRRGGQKGAVALLLLAALLLRADAAARWWLSPWDERYHALVAKNILEHPLTPTLVDQPVEDLRPKPYSASLSTSNWTNTHIWIHKPPLTFLMMAGCMKLLGANEIALRIPSVLLGTLGVLVTFLLAKRFLDLYGAFFAAVFHLWSGRSIHLAGGMRATDHVDNLFAFFIALGVLVAVCAADAFAEKRPRRAWLLTFASGVVLGLGFLTKEGPAIIIPGVFLLRLLTNRVSWSVRLLAPAACFAVGALMFAPWLLYTASAFPEHYAVKSKMALIYFTTAVDGHEEVWYWHFENIFRHFGYLTFLPVTAFLCWGAARRRKWLPLVLWFIFVYGVFSIAATKMKSYVFIASPVIWCALGWFTAATVMASRELRPVARRSAVALGFLVALTFFYSAALRPISVQYPRNPLWAKEMRYLSAQIDRLRPGKWAVFNVYAPTEAMFYSDATCEYKPPDARKLQMAREKDFNIAVFGWLNDPALAPLRSESDVTFIPPDPRTLAARGIYREIVRRKLDNVLICNARRAKDLELYLCQIIWGRHPVKAVTQMPRLNRYFLKQTRKKKKRLMVLVVSGTPGVDRVREEFPDAIIVNSETYANLRAAAAPAPAFAAALPRR